VAQNRDTGRLALAARRLACWGALAAVGLTAAMTGASPAIAASGAIRPDALTPAWSVTSSRLSATGVTYTYDFTATVLLTTISITMTVPSGTAGTPAIGPGTTPTGLGGSVTLASNKLTVSQLSLGLGSTDFHIVITGLTNTGTAGPFASVVTTTGLSGDSGTSNSVTFGTPTVTAPAGLAWAGTLTGSTLNLVDTSAADQQLTGGDVETLGTAWTITVSATTFTGTAGTLADAGSFTVNGSLTSGTATAAPAASCAPSCSPPANGVAYPVAITTAAAAPPAVRVYSATSATGLGTITLTSIGWWVRIPATIRAGSLGTTMTISIASGP